MTLAMSIVCVIDFCRQQFNHVVDQVETCYRAKDCQGSERRASCFASVMHLLQR